MHIAKITLDSFPVEAPHWSGSFEVYIINFLSLIKKLLLAV